MKTVQDIFNAAQKFFEDHPEDVSYLGEDYTIAILCGAMAKEYGCEVSPEHAGMIERAVALDASRVAKLQTDAVEFAKTNRQLVEELGRAEFVKMIRAETFTLPG